MHTNIAYMKTLAAAVARLHQCSTLHLQTVPVTLNEGGSFWQGDVEVFALLSGSEARKCFAWTNSSTEAVVVLATSEIASPMDAVRSHRMNGCSAAAA
jgi:hypothetical protein